MAYSNKSQLSQSQHTFSYPDKDVESIQKPTTTSSEFHSTNLEKYWKWDMGGDTFDKIYTHEY